MQMGLIHSQQPGSLIFRKGEKKVLSVTVMISEELFVVEESGWHLRPHGIVHTTRLHH